MRGFKSDITGLRHQRGAKADLKFIDLGGSITEVSKSFRKTCSAHHFQQNVRNAAFGHLAVHLAAQCDQAVRFVHPIQFGNDDPVFATGAFETKIGVVFRARCNTCKGCIQKFGQKPDFSGTVKLAAQCSANNTLCVVPGPPLQHTDSWVCIPDAGGSKDIPALYGFMPSVDGCENISFGVSCSACGIHHIGTPRLGNYASRGFFDGCLGPIRLFAQPGDCAQNIMAARACGQFDTRGDIEKTIFGFGANGRSTPCMACRLSVGSKYRRWLRPA